MTNAGLHRLAEALPVAVVVRVGDRIAFANRAALGLLGCRSKAEVVERDFGRALDAASDTVALVRPDGTTLVVELRRAELEWGGAPATLVQLAEAARRTAAEPGRPQAQQALGTLIDGVAHEFNNLLVPIIGLTQFAMRDLAEDSPTRANLERVLAAARRTADMVARFRVLNNLEEGACEPVSACDVVHETIESMRPALPSSIRLTTRFHDAGSVLCRKIQLQVLVMNLISNALQAMEGRVGELAVGVGRLCSGTPVHLKRGTLLPGDFIKVTVRDTGHGMTESVMQRAFEPFFTTWKAGANSGMGLTVVDAIVSELGGAIDPSSEAGAGTALDVYLPRLDRPDGES